ncbi:MAG: rRNA maturation RNase YbeY [Acidobacteriales bacterium]|nr:rRNA maturation RNase YbeY [Terriglobales bacterium]
MVILKHKVPGLTALALSRFVQRAKRVEKLKGTVDVLVTTSREIRELNRRFRGENRTTDVLSFPAGLDFAGKAHGDIAISAELAAHNADALGHSAAEEVKLLTLHGILHLAGYDHEEDGGEMANREEWARKTLGLPMGLITRTIPRSPRRQAS